MALNAYLRIKGQKQGDIKGSVAQKGREGLIEVHAYSHTISSPRDPASGQAIGRRQHGVLRITKLTEQSTTALYQALIQNELLTVELFCYEPNKLGPAGGGGTESQYFTIQLTNAQVVEIVASMANNLVPATQSLPQMEDVSFTYGTITWTSNPGSKSVADDWFSQRG